MSKKNHIRKNRSWPMFYAVIINDDEIETYKNTQAFCDIVSFLKKKQMILQEAMRANCRIFYSRKKRCLVLFSAIKWNVSPQLAKLNVQITTIKNRHAHHAYLMKIMRDEDPRLIHPETGEPCSLEQFCSAEAARSN